MKKFRETVLDNNRRHGEYLEYYWKKQLSAILYVSTAFWVLEILMCLVGVQFEHASNIYLGRIKYAMGIPFFLACSIWAAWVLYSKKIPYEKKPKMSEAVAFTFGLLACLWGVFAMEFSMTIDKTINVLMFILALGIITAFFKYPGHHYFLIIFISYSAAALIFIKHDELIMDVTSQICAVLMMLLLFRLGKNNYINGRNRYEAERDNARMMMDLEAQNEELNAGNQELLSINEVLYNTKQELEKALKEIEAKTEAQKRFTASMNHELRAPLNGIIGNIQILLLDENINSETKESLNQCMRMSKALLGIVNDLLDYAKIEAGEFEILPAAFDLHDVINNVVEIFDHQAKAKGLELKANIADDMVCGLYGDDYRIQQVLTNIVSNGVKYTDQGSVEISARFEEDNLIFTVEDTGQGISEQSIKDLFKPYKRIDEFKNKKIQGTGLGMTIVGSLIKQMNGTIDVSSTVGKGTTFVITIPSKITDSENTWAEGKITQMPTDDKSGIPNLKGKRIIYVDDTKMNLTIVKKLLADTGVQLDTTDNPSVGLEMTTVNEYDLIIVDHQMPDIPGPELLDKIREASSKNKITPAIVFTGNAGTGVGEMYKEMGFEGYLTKPVLRNDLFELIMKII